MSTVQEEVLERSIAMAEDIIETGSTIREVAERFKVGKTTVHRNLTVTLLQHNHKALYDKVYAILREHRVAAPYLGGIATKKKYEDIKK